MKFNKTTWRKNVQKREHWQIEKSWLCSVNLYQVFNVKACCSSFIELKKRKKQQINKKESNQQEEYKRFLSSGNKMKKWVANEEVRKGQRERKIEVKTFMGSHIDQRFREYENFLLYSEIKFVEKAYEKIFVILKQSVIHCHTKHTAQCTQL